MTDLRKAAEMTQPEALRLADMLELWGSEETLSKAAVELRRLHEENERLRQALAQPEQRGHCTCGDPEALGVVHFRTRPCFHYTEPLAQPGQKPVAWINNDYEVFFDAGKAACYSMGWIKPLYTAPPKREWVGLTDAEVESWRGNYDFFDSALVREVEAKLKEKNGVL